MAHTTCALVNILGPSPGRYCRIEVHRLQRRLLPDTCIRRTGNRRTIGAVRCNRYLLESVIQRIRARSKMRLTASSSFAFPGGIGPLEAALPFSYWRTRFTWCRDLPTASASSLRRCSARRPTRIPLTFINRRPDFKVHPHNSQGILLSGTTGPHKRCWAGYKAWSSSLGDLICRAAWNRPLRLSRKLRDS